MNILKCKVNTYYNLKKAGKFPNISSTLRHLVIGSIFVSEEEIAIHVNNQTINEKREKTNDRISKLKRCCYKITIYTSL